MHDISRKSKAFILPDVADRHISPSLFSRIVVMLSAMNHFCPFMTTFDGDSCVAPISADHTITVEFASSFAVRWNLKIVSKAPALRSIRHPLNATSCYKKRIRMSARTLTKPEKIN